MAAPPPEVAVPSPVTETLETKDGAVLSCRWYPSPNSKEDGKNVVPVMILHGWGGQSSQYDGLATELQKKGHAVIVPDLRGHGGSTTLKRPNEAKNVKLKIAENGGFEADSRPVAVNLVMDYMFRYDMERVKAFLTQKNNDGEVNIELLCVVAFEASAIVAVNWAAQDWSWPQYAALKQGQDVKALALISPRIETSGAPT